MKRLPPLTALRAFEAVGRLGHVKEAADELNVTPAAVSHQIRALEEHLEVELFSRSTRNLQLTRCGSDFLSAVSGAFEMLKEGADRLSRETGRQRLVVNSLPTFASNFLVPRLLQFHNAHPDLEMEINTSVRFGDPGELKNVGADIAIRAGLHEGAWPGMVAERLVPGVRFPGCAPGLLQASGPLASPAALANQARLIVSRTPEGWPDWLDAARSRGLDTTGVDSNHGLRFDTIQLAMTAAIEGLGVVIGRRPLVDAYLDSGLLVAPFDLEITSKIAYWLVYPPRMAQTERLRAFRDWLRTELSLPQA